MSSALAVSDLTLELTSSEVGNGGKEEDLQVPSGEARGGKNGAHNRASVKGNSQQLKLHVPPHFADSPDLNLVAQGNL